MKIPSLLKKNPKRSVSHIILLKLQKKKKKAQQYFEPVRTKPHQPSKPEFIGRIIEDDKDKTNCAISIKP